MSDAVSPETVALARRRYAEGATINSIRAETGIARLAVLYRCLDGELDDGTGAPQPIPRRAGQRSARNAGDRRAALVKRLWRSAERQVRTIEQRLDLAGDEPSERDARMFAVMVKTVRELSVLDRQQQEQAPAGAAAPDDDDPVPRDLDEFRRALALKIEDFIRARTDAGVPADPEVDVE